MPAHAEPAADAGGGHLAGLVDDGPEDLTAADGAEHQTQQITEEQLVSRTLAGFAVFQGVSKCTTHEWCDRNVNGTQCWFSVFPEGTGLSL